MRSIRTLAVLVAALALLAPASAAARPSPPHVSWVKCLRLCGSAKNEVQRGGDVKVAGRRFSTGSRVVFQVKRDGKRTTHTVAAKLTGTTRLTVTMPTGVLSGRIYVRVRGGQRSNNSGPLKIVKAPSTGPSSDPGRGTAFDKSGMWIWQLEKSQGGDPTQIVAQAKAHDVSTVFIKSGDTTSYWDQFSPELVNALKSGGLKVCGWQYVKGDDPAGEAAVAQRAVTNGADCFVIDAESEYEKNKYEAAATYMSTLRAGVGADYPIGLTTFPYVDVHPSFPYSVFLGPGGAQFNLPQIYWKAIGDSVDQAVTRTYAWNRPYNVPIAPLGQTYSQPPIADMTRFRQLVGAEGSTGLSWWSWQETQDPEWSAIGDPLPGFTGPPPAQDFAALQQGSKGDIVRWAQQHLHSADGATTIDGQYGAGTAAAVTSFQQSKGLPATGKIDTATWIELLKLPAATSRRSPKTATIGPRKREFPATAGLR
jgi:hypothetical protein